MANHGPKLITPAGPSKSIFQPHPATVAHVPLPAASTATTGNTGNTGNAGKASPPNGGKPA